MAQAEHKVFHPVAGRQATTGAGAFAPTEFFTALGLIHGERADIVEEVRLGFPVSVVAKLKERLDVPQKLFFRVAGLSSATMSRRAKTQNKRLTSAESDRLYRIADVFRQAIQLFEGDAGAAQRWMKEPAKALGGKTPFDHLDTGAGADEVRDLIGRIEHGVFS
jgi:putative toxin-antitoxin system antitoxin component (TIGR02293 family)